MIYFLPYNAVDKSFILDKKLLTYISLSDFYLWTNLLLATVKWGSLILSTVNPWLANDIAHF
jgi:hypothetical protein